MLRKATAGVLLVLGLVAWVIGLLSLADGSTARGVAVMAGAGLFLFVLAVGYHRTDPVRRGDASVWRAIRDGLFGGFGP
jgi:hypothetical protein